MFTKLTVVITLQCIQILSLITSARNWPRAFPVLPLWPTQALAQGMTTWRPPTGASSVGQDCLDPDDLAGR